MKKYQVKILDGTSYEVIVGDGIIAKSDMEMPAAPTSAVRMAHRLYIAARVAGKTTAPFDEWVETYDTFEDLESGESPEPSAT